MSAEFWPWWLSAGALAAVALVHLVLTGRGLGVSGAWAKVANYRSERAAEAMQRDMLADAETERALLAATRAQFGTDAAAPAPPAPAVGAPPLSANASALFLVSLMLGGAASAILRGDWGDHHSLGDTFARLWGNGAGGLVVLVLGGVLVGFGTRLSGGCTSGHGLMGCSRLQTPSLVATATFLGTAVAVSLLLEQAGMR